MTLRAHGNGKGGGDKQKKVEERKGFHLPLQDNATTRRSEFIPGKLRHLLRRFPALFLEKSDRRREGEEEKEKRAEEGIN